MTAIHIKFPALTLKAGTRALARIREQGLKPADVGILPGAAGGPKALGIQGYASLRRDRLTIRLLQRLQWLQSLPAWLRRS
jgi:hypothetical protein